MAGPTHPKAKPFPDFKGTQFGISNLLLTLQPEPRKHVSGVRETEREEGDTADSSAWFSSVFPSPLAATEATLPG